MHWPPWTCPARWCPVSKPRRRPVRRQPDLAPIRRPNPQHSTMQLHRVHHQILRSHHLFEPLSEAQLDTLLQTARLVNVDKGAKLFHQGEPAHAFYFVISGTVKIFRLTPDGQEKVFEVIGSRQTFAEAMMLMDTPDYVASAQAIAPSQLYRFSNSTYMELLQNNSKLTFALLAKLCIPCTSASTRSKHCRSRTPRTAWCGIC